MLTVAFHSFPDYSNNARALFEYMHKKYKTKIHFIWIVNTDDAYKKLQRKKIEVIKENSKDIGEKINKVDVFFTTHASLIDYKVQNSHTLYIELWHGVSPKNVGYLIKNMSEKDYQWCNRVHRKVDYFVVPSEFWVPIFSARFNILPERILPLGFPMLDNIVNAKGRENLAKVLDCDISKYKKIIYYMPTARLGFGRNEDVTVNFSNTLNLKPYDEQDLINYLEEKKYLLCFSYHPSEELEFKCEDKKNIKFINKEMLQKHGFDVNMILNGADLLISDYSSLGILFLILNKPVIYLSNDMEEYAKSRGILFNSFSFWTDNNDVKTLDELINKINYEFNNKNEHINERKRLFFGNLKDGGCANIVDRFFTSDGQLKENITYTYDEVSALQKENQKIKSELEKIYNSKGYRLLEKWRKVRHRK